MAPGRLVVVVGRLVVGGRLLAPCRLLAPRRLLVLVAVALGLLGVTAGGGAAGTLSGPAQRATVYLERAQNVDGGLGEAPGQGSAQLFAGWAALGLASAGVDVGTLRRAAGDPTLLSYVRGGETAADTGSLERTILVLRAAGVPAGGLVARLLGRVSARGSVDGQVNLTAFALLALRAAGGPVAVEGRLAAWLTGQCDADGGYGYDGRGSGSDADDTGAVLEALAGRFDAGDVHAAVIAAVRRRAVAYLRADEDRDGGFPDAPGAGSDAQSTAWAVQGLIAAGTSPGSLRRDGHSPLGYLDSLVAASGAVSYARGQTQTPVWVTGEALMALDGRPLPLAGPAGAGAVASGSSSSSSSSSSSVAGARRTGAVRRADRASSPARRRRAPGGGRHRTRSDSHARRSASLSALTRATAVAIARMQASVGALASRVIAGVRLGG